MGKPFAQLFQRVVGIRFRLQDFRAALPGSQRVDGIFSDNGDGCIFILGKRQRLAFVFQQNRPCSGDFLRCFMLFSSAVFRLLRLWSHQKF